MVGPVSVIVPAFNAAATLRRALDSAKAQTLAPSELIVVDDGSTDATADLAAAHPAVTRLIRHERNRGSAAALNTGLAAATGPLVALLDADDEWLPGKLGLQLPTIRPGDRLSATGFAFIGRDGREAWTWGEEPAAAAPPQRYWPALLAHSQIAKPTVLAPLEAVRAAGGFDPAMPVAEDQDLWIRLALAGPVRYLPDVLARVHDTPGSLAKRQTSPDRDHVLPMVERWLAALADRLTPAEVRAIRVRRYAAAARNLAGAGRSAEALPFARTAIRNGAPAAPLVAALARGLLPARHKAP